MSEGDLGSVELMIGGRGVLEGCSCQTLYPKYCFPKACTYTCLLQGPAGLLFKFLYYCDKICVIQAKSEEA